MRNYLWKRLWPPYAEHRQGGWRNDISRHRAANLRRTGVGETNIEAGLLSREATAAIGSAFNALTETVKKHEPTLEDLVHETLRPMLKSWLDENLPSVVERMVQAEIERVTRGR